MWLFYIYNGTLKIFLLNDRQIEAITLFCIQTLTSEWVPFVNIIYDKQSQPFFPMQEAYLWGVRKFLQPDKDAPAQAFIAKMGRFYYKVSNICAV